MYINTYNIVYMQVIQKPADTYTYSHKLRGSVLWFRCTVQLEEE